VGTGFPKKDHAQTEDEIMTRFNESDHDLVLRKQKTPELLLRGSCVRPNCL